MGLSSELGRTLGLVLALGGNDIGDVAASLEVQI